MLNMDMMRDKGLGAGNSSAPAEVARDVPVAVLAFLHPHPHPQLNFDRPSLLALFDNSPCGICSSSSTRVMLANGLANWKGHVH